MPTQCLRRMLYSVENRTETLGLLLYYKISMAGNPVLSAAFCVTG